MTKKEKKKKLARCLYSYKHDRGWLTLWRGATRHRWRSTTDWSRPRIEVHQEDCHSWTVAHPEEHQTPRQRPLAAIDAKRCWCPTAGKCLHHQWHHCWLRELSSSHTGFLRFGVRRQRERQGSVAACAATQRSGWRTNQKTGLNLMFHLSYKWGFIHLKAHLNCYENEICSKHTKHVLAYKVHNGNHPFLIPWTMAFSLISVLEKMLNQLCTYLVWRLDSLFCWGIIIFWYCGI